MTDLEHEVHIRRCVALATAALATDDTPVGAVIVRGDEVIAEGIEAVRGRGDVTAHAEIEALRAAFKALDSLDLTGCTLYTSVEPCVMCAYAIRLAHISLVVSGARTDEAGRPISGYNVLTDQRILPSRTPVPVVRDILADECESVLDAHRGPRLR